MKVLHVVAALLVFYCVVACALVIFFWHSLLHTAANAVATAGNLQSARGNYTQAEDLFDQALWIDPNNTEAYIGRSLEEVIQRKPKEALADAEQAVKLEPKVSKTYATRGIAREASRDLEGAHKDYDEAILLRPNYASYYEPRGRIRFLQGEIDGALADENQAIDLNPRLASAFSARAEVEVWKGDREGAGGDYDQAIELAPTKLKYYEDRAQFRTESDDLSGGLDDVQHVLQAKPDDFKALYLQGIVQRRLSDFPASLQSLTRALDLYPHSGSTFLERGFTKYAAGDRAGAQADFESSRQTEAERPYGELWLWIVGCENGQKADADKRLSDFFDGARGTKAGQWPAKLADLVLGRRTPDELAQTVDPTESDRLKKPAICQVWYYAGKAALLAGDKVTAKADFQKSVATGVYSRVESSEAKRELSKL